MFSEFLSIANDNNKILEESDNWSYDGNRTEWSPIRSVIIQVITKSDDHAAGVRFVYHEYDYRQNWTTRSLNFVNHKNYNFREKKKSYERKGKFALKN